MIEFEIILKEWPQFSRKIKSVSKQIEDLTSQFNKNEAVEQLMAQVKKDVKRLEGDITGKSDGNPKKLT